MSSSRKDSPSTRGPQGPASRNGKARVRSVTRTEAAEPEQLKPNGAAEAAREEPAPRRRLSRRRILLAVVVTIVMVVAAVFLWGFVAVQRTLPTINGTIKVGGLSAPVTITRDSYGVPHITGANMNDVAEGLGYVHAQDRLFEMDFFRAVDSGRLSEFAGSSTVGTDRFLRTVGYRRAAEAEYAILRPEVRSWLEAYSRGVNEFIHSHEDSLPLEFMVLGTKMEDWTPVDSIAFGKLQAWDLTDTWDTDLTMSDLLAKLPAERVSTLMPGYPTSGPFIVPSAAGYTDMLRQYAQNVEPWLSGLGLRDLGSNNWVVDGTKSATGKPLLSNDPHLALRNPSVWYQAHLKTTDGKLDITGFGFPGAPGIVTGHNTNIAWGVTNTEVDVQDVYEIQTDDAGHPGQYFTAGGWKPLQVLTDTIDVKGSSPVSLTVRITDKGPILSDAFTEPYTITLGSTITMPYALQWTAAQPGHLIDALYDLQRASNWQEFRSALKEWDVPGQNFVYADTQGNIGYQMTGQVPIRKKGDGKVSADGSLPMPGWDDAYGWSGFIPFEQLPSAYNPPDHFIATANNQPFGPNYPYQIRGYYAYPWRISRIQDMLKAKDKLSVTDFESMLMDTVSPVAKEMAPLLANLKPTDDTTKQAAAMFKDWNGDLKADSVPAAIYEVTLSQVLTDTFSDELGTNLFGEYLSRGPQATRALELLLQKPNDPFWDRTDTPQKETRDDILLRGLTEAVTAMRGALGDNLQDWTWGKLHTVNPEHLVLGEQSIISGAFNLPSVPIGGDGTTVSIGTYSLTEPTGGPFWVRTHQSYRMILDTSNWSNSLAIYATGQSGQPFAKHWGDMLTTWQQGGFDNLLYTQQQIDAQKEGVLTLTP